MENAELFQLQIDNNRIKTLSQDYRSDVSKVAYLWDSYKVNKNTFDDWDFWDLTKIPLRANDIIHVRYHDPEDDKIILGEYNMYVCEAILRPNGKSFCPMIIYQPNLSVMSFDLPVLKDRKEIETVYTLPDSISLKAGALIWKYGPMKATKWVVSFSTGAGDVKTENLSQSTSAFGADIVNNAYESTGGAPGQKVIKIKAQATGTETGNFGIKFVYTYDRYYETH